MAAKVTGTGEGSVRIDTDKSRGGLTQSDQVLISFYRAANATTARVPYEEIVLQAWRDFPESFSLRNHPEHPDASDIHKKLYQTLKPGGFVVSLGNKVFRLTDAGVARAAALQATATGPAKSQARLSRDENRLLQHALRSRAFAKWEADQDTDIIDYDARLFFQFSTGTPKKDRRIRLKAMQDMIESARGSGHPSADNLSRLTTFLYEEFSGLFEEES